MKLSILGVIAAVLLPSTFLLATSVSDPIIKLGPGIEYLYQADIVSVNNGHNFELQFDGHPVSFTNPFDDFAFCSNITVGDFTGRQCNFNNESGVPITELAQDLVTSFGDNLHCANDFTDASCGVTGDGSGVSFGGFSVDSADLVWEYDSVNTSFHLQYLGDSSGSFNAGNAAIEDFFLNGLRVVPEPASLGMLVSGLLGLGLTLRRKTGARSNHGG